MTSTARRSESLLLGFDVGGTKTAVCLWSEGGERLGRKQWATPADPRQGFDALIAQTRRLLEEAGRDADAVAGIGVSAGAITDPEAGTLLSVPNLPAWRNVEVGPRLHGAFGTPWRVENDANACALAEWLEGAGRGARNMAFLTCSTGIGAGLVLDGRLYRGSRNLAGEIGHVVVVPEGEPCGCGRRGCLEAYAGGAGIARRLARLRERRPELPRDARELCEAARAGDRFARAFVERTAEYLARGIAGLLFTLDLERVVLGTIPTKAGDVFLEPLRRETARLLWPELRKGLQILPSALGDALGDRAAYRLALEAAGRTSDPRS